MNKAWKHVSLQVIFVYWHSTYILSVPNMGVKLTCTNFWNSCICSRPTAYTWSTWIRNLIRA